METVVIVKAKKLYDEYLDIHYWECIEKLNRTLYIVDPDCAVQYNEKLQRMAKEASSIDKLRELEKRKRAWRAYFATKEKFRDFKYIYASTIHKSQGSTFDTVYIDTTVIASLINRYEHDMAYRLLYVAITRASKDIILFS